MEKALEAIFQKTLAHYGAADVSRLALDIFGGCYNYRPMRGGKSWSMHAFGIAVDLDPENNQLKWTEAKAKFTKADYVPFWNFVESEGAVSLGRAKDYTGCISSSRGSDAKARSSRSILAHPPCNHHRHHSVVRWHGHISLGLGPRHRPFGNDG
ncbi:hypothetical protein ACDY96_00045 [Rhizobium mongolense]|uniref:hypothetical protein n=1 Tax=Rhizobium mongolense TaxID=57676 RepID=UPI0035575706